MLVLFDGVCGLCNRAVWFLLERDHAARFRFAPLQSDEARRLGARHGFDVDDLDTMYLVVDYGGSEEHLLCRSPAVFAALSALGGWWSLFGLLRWLPRSLTDWGYGVVARNRYRLFGKREECPIPPPEWRSRFIEGDSANGPEGVRSPSVDAGLLQPRNRSDRRPEHASEQGNVPDQNR